MASCSIHHCGPVLKTVPGTHTTLNKYLLNKRTNEFCDFMICTRITTTSSMVWKEEELSFNRRKWWPTLISETLGFEVVFKAERGSLPASLSWRVLLQGGGEKAQQKREKTAPVRVSSALDTGPGSLTETCTGPLKWRAWHAASSRLHRRFSLEKEGNFSITLSQVALVALHQGHFSHSLDQAQERDGRHRSLLQETFSIGYVELCFPSGALEFI